MGAGSSHLGGSSVAVTRGDDEEVNEGVSDEDYIDKDEAHDEDETMNDDESDGELKMTRQGEEGWQGGGEG